MGLITLFKRRKKIFTVADIASDEIAMIALAFLIAKYFSVVTSLSWYWYVLIVIIFLIKPLFSLIQGSNIK